MNILLYQTKTATVSGSGYTPVTFTFTPIQRSLVDWFEVSVKNPRTGADVLANHMVGYTRSLLGICSGLEHSLAC